MIYTLTLNPAIDRTLTCEHFTPGTVNSTEIAGIFPAGKGINVSRCLAALGHQSTALGFVGRDDKDWFRSFLLTSKVLSRFTPVAGRTRFNTTVIDRTLGHDTHIKEPGFTVSNEEIFSLFELLEQVISTGDTLIISGSLPGGCTSIHLQGIIDRMKIKNAVIIADLPGDQLQGIARTAPALIKPNHGELAQLTGLQETESMLCKAYSMGFPAILLSLGKEGLAFFNGNDLLMVPAMPVEAVSTVGAGDAALAGFIAARQAGHPLPLCLRWAAAAGAANVRERFAGVIDGEWFNKAVEGRQTEN